MPKKTYTEAIFSDPELKTPAHDAIMIWLDQNLEALLQEHGFLEGKRYVADKIWEAPIIKRSERLERTIGFIDMKVLVGEDREKMDRIGTRDLHKDELEEFLADGYKNENEYLTKKVVRQEIVKTLYLEVKPSIKALGELIRQIRFYQTALSPHSISEFIIVSPDDRFKNILKDQGIGFIKAEQISAGPQGTLF